MLDGIAGPITGIMPRGWVERQLWLTALHLDRMTPPDLAAFVRQWHQAVRELGDELPCAVGQLPRYGAVPAVAAWLKAPEFAPPEVKRLSLYDCVLPDDLRALDFPGVEVVVR